MASLESYMSRYDREHAHPANRILHGIGIPVILASFVCFVLLGWKWGAALFVLGSALLFIGHRIEGNRPAFFQGVIYFLVGPLWVAKELKEALLGRQPAPPR